jgi:hypothetical protein
MYVLYCLLCDAVMRLNVLLVTISRPSAGGD